MSDITPPRWQDLLARYLDRPQDVPAEGEVELYQAQPALGLDLTTAWQDALLPGTSLGEAAPDTSYPDAWQQARTCQWSTPFPCCVGLAPQFLQQIHALMEDARGFFQAPTGLNASGIAEDPPRDAPWLIRLALARATGNLPSVDALLTQSARRPDVLLQNERAAQAWLRGDRAGAARLWESLPDDQPVIAFNQALASLAQGDFGRGRQKLAKAATGFPETTGWRHLADLYRVALGE